VHHSAVTEPLPPRLLELLTPPSTGVVALAARHLETGRIWRHNERVVMPSASLIKLPILATFWETVESGRIDPNERVTVPAEANVGGTGVLKALAPGLQPTWSDLATLMITVSDNTATNLIIDRLGMETIQAWIDRAGLADTRIERRMMDRVAMAAGRQNRTSAADMEALLATIATASCVSAEASRDMRRALEAQQIHDRLPRRLGDRVRIANKTGNFTDVIHDVGLATNAGGTLVVAMLTSAVRPAWVAMDIISEAAALLVGVEGASAK
jgi:beta-lactamase class A